MGKGIALVVALVSALAMPTVAQAAFPGDDGRIAYTRTSCTGRPCSYLFTVNPDGSDPIQLAAGARPAWSADGTKLAFVDGSSIYTMNADGTGQSLVLAWTAEIRGVAWAPDGTKLAAALQNCSDDECRTDIYTMNPDGTAVTDLTPDLLPDTNPSWSPDGSKIAFDTVRSANFEIFTMNADGSGATNVTNDPGTDTDPNWSPDGTSLAFSRSGGSGQQLWLMNADGSGQRELAGPQPALAPAWSPDGSLIAYAVGQFNRQLHVIDVQSGVDAKLSAVENAYDDNWPDWQPSDMSSGGYPRPRGATPFFTYLVPSYELCSAPDSSHGPPLAFGSCEPPVQASSRLTIGTPDANGLQARGRSWLRLHVLAGNPTTPGDEADVELLLRAGDVRRAADLSDYPGELALAATARITDRANTPGPSPATVEDVPVSAPVPCVANPDSQQGADCDLDTTIDAILGGNAIVEGARSVWELGQVELRDGGADGSAATEPNELFEVQGLFVP